MRALSASFLSRAKVLPRLGQVVQEGPMIADEIEGGRVSADGDYLWEFKGSLLEIYRMKKKENPYPVGHFSFVHLLSDSQVTITSVVELRDHFKPANSTNTSLNFLVTLNRSRISGLGSILCVVDGLLSKITKAIECPFRVSYTEPIAVSQSAQKYRNLYKLSPELLPMHGVIAVGTETGLVVFIDLCLDQTCDVVLPPHKLTYAVKPSAANISYDINEKRRNALIHGQHLGLQLNGNSQNKTKFFYRKDSGDIMTTFAAKDVYISCLKYIHQTNSLCVGFNFGGFQLWNLKTLSLDCVCTLDPSLQAVVSFAFQEPENDPKNFCYLWIVRGSSLTEDPVNSNKRYTEIVGPSIAFLYSLSYESKEWLPHFGTLYRTFVNCMVRFEYNLTYFPHLQSIENVVSSQLISCYTLELGNAWATTNSDDESHTDLSLCLFAWEALSETSEAAAYFFAIFDLNQYYQAQMPSEYSPSENSTQWCSYLGVFSLAEVNNVLSSEIILDVRLHPESITKFRLDNINHDLHFYPSALSCDATILSERAVVDATYLGLQKRALSQVTSAGPAALVDPKQLIADFVQVGLLPTDATITCRNAVQQREAILNLMLETDELSFIIDVINQWASNDLKHVGCTCRSVLEWIWDKVSSIKTCIDQFSYPLFNYSHEVLDSYALKTLSAYEVDLMSLGVLLKALRDNGGPSTAQGLSELNLRHEVTILVADYLRVMLWLVDSGLLPEFEENYQCNEKQVAYPRLAFEEDYKLRREELKMNDDPNAMLIIDNIFKNLEPVENLWKNAGGSGLYPPPNIHSLLNIYLLGTISIDQKHQLMLYFLMDITAYLSDRDSGIAEKIKLFPTAFSLKPSLNKFAQGIWALDHRLLEFGLSLLSVPSVKSTYFSVNEDEDSETEMNAKTQLHQQILAAFSRDQNTEITRSIRDQTIDANSEILKILEPTPVKKVARRSLLATPNLSRSILTPPSILKVKSMIRASSPSIPGSHSNSALKGSRLRFAVKSPEGDQDTSMDVDNADITLQEDNIAAVCPPIPEEGDVDMRADDADFAFSPPKETKSGLSMHEPDDRPVTPTNPSYVFSPPVTRSRSKKKQPKANKDRFAPPIAEEPPHVMFEESVEMECVVPPADSDRHSEASETDRRSEISESASEASTTDGQGGKERKTKKSTRKQNESDSTPTHGMRLRTPTPSSKKKPPKKQTE